MKFKIIKLYFDSMLHIGDIGFGLEKSSFHIYSDTLFGAIANAWFLLYDKIEVEKFLEMNSEKPKFKISSAFPFNNSQYYLPKLIGYFDFVDTGFLGKNIRKAEFIDFLSFEKMINGSKLDQNDYSKLSEAISNLNEIYKTIEMPKNALDRQTNMSNIYYLEVLKFAKNCGLYFFIDSDNDVYKEWIIPALKILQDEGIGGKRSWGNGLFKFKEDTLSIKTPDDANFYETLSLFYPDINLGENLIFQNGFWVFKKRGGWIYDRSSGIKARKPRIFLIKEGSFFSKEPKGTILDLNFSNLNHKIYHYGLCFSLPIKLVINNV